MRWFDIRWFELSVSLGGLADWRVPEEGVPPLSDVDENEPDAIVWLMGADGVRLFFDGACCMPHFVCCRAPSVILALTTTII
eukprot:COSAG01_NODE_32570_length_578_cov_542.112735_1_plen_82_part_00